jgi:hypothetical protein
MVRTLAIKCDYHRKILGLYCHLVKFVLLLFLLHLGKPFLVFKTACVRPKGGEVGPPARFRRTKSAGIPSEESARIHLPFLQNC